MGSMRWPLLTMCYPGFNPQEQKSYFSAKDRKTRYQNSKKDWVLKIQEIYTDRWQTTVERVDSLLLQFVWIFSQTNTHPPTLSLSLSLYKSNSLSHTHFKSLQIAHSLTPFSIVAIKGKLILFLSLFVAPCLMKRQQKKINHFVALN